MIVILVNYVIYLEVIGFKWGIFSFDFCGFLYDRIEEKVGGIVLFMNGVVGGMVIVDNRLEGGGDVCIWEECICIGMFLVDEVLCIFFIVIVE